MSWIQTYMGHKFDPLNIDLETIDIVDIAHSLAMKPRFNGHCEHHYSVAEHCITMARLVEPQYAIHALLHDAAEAYLPDVPAPIKPHLIGFKEIEDNIMAAIYRKYNLETSPEIERAVKVSDLRILHTEKLQLLKDPNIKWNHVEKFEPYNIALTCCSASFAKQIYLKSFNDLINEL